MTVTMDAVILWAKEASVLSLCVLPGVAPIAATQCRTLYSLQGAKTLVVVVLSGLLATVSGYI